MKKFERNFEEIFEKFSNEIMNLKNCEKNSQKYWADPSVRLSKKLATYQKILRVSVF